MHVSSQLSPVPTEHPVVVLLVDDQAIVGESVRRMLAAESGISFHFCQDPAKAIATANEVRPTVILQDLVMPDIDGLQLVKFFRANPATRDTPMIVLSSKEDPEVKARAFALGANDYLVRWPDTLEVVARVRYHSRGYINLLERNEAYRQLAESQRLLAHEVSQAANYVQSLLPARRAGTWPSTGGSSRPPSSPATCSGISDVDMPRMDGLQMVEAIRREDRLRHLPVVIVSYKERDEDRMRELKAGANAYLTKSSFHDHTFLRTVADLIGGP